MPIAFFARRLAIPSTLTLLCATVACNNHPAGGPAQNPSAGATVSPGQTAALRAAYIAAAQADAGPAYALLAHGAELAAENPAQRLRAQATTANAGMRVSGPAREGAAADRLLDLALHSVGCGGSLQPAGRAVAQHRENRVEYVRPGLTEWYVNGPMGIEQGFTLSQRPDCGASSDLQLDVSVGDRVTPTLHGSGDSSSYVELRDAAHARWLRYSDVVAYDARKHVLPSRLSVVDGRIRIEVQDEGAQYPVTIDPLVWTLDQQVLGSDTAANDFFGRSVAISGTTAVVGAWQATVGGKAGQGAAYVFLRSGTAWMQQAKLTAGDGAADDAFGYAVALSGNTAVVTAAAAKIGMASGAGAAYVFVRSGSTWTQQQKLTAADAAADDSFGESVAIDGDTTVVGAAYADVMGDGDRGAAYVFVRSGTTWTQQQKLAPADGAAGDHAGQSVAISGNSALFGAPFADVGTRSSAGVAYVYLRTGTTWALQQKLNASDAASTDGFGGAVALVSDTALVGADAADVGGKTDAGAAYVFGRMGMTWAQLQKLSPSVSTVGEAFGTSVALASGGSGALIGADGNAAGGAAYVFGKSGMTWSLQQQLMSPLVGADGNFGRGVAIDGDNAMVGAPFSNLPGKPASGVTISFTLGMTKGNGQSCVGAVECTSGFCTDGVCCATACGGGAADCQVCSTAAGGSMDGTCTMAKMGSTCRAAVGGCDVAESCDGTSPSCPTDSFKPNTTECRGAAGACDVAEFCTGSSATCPGDNLKPATAECRAAVGACDVAEKCTGTSINCPTDSFKPNTTECRAASAVCDQAEFCTGTSAGCPTDTYKPKMTVCRAASGLCDAVETCTGTAATCPTDTFLPKLTECRAAAGVCDAPETCTGASADCPVDVFKPTTSECRPAAGACDAAEFCSGSDAGCPTDGYKPSGVECRAVAGACDVAESCTGTSPACPKDTFKPVDTACRPATGECDVGEACTGSAAACPTDSFVAAGTACNGGTCRAGMCRAEADLSVQLVPPTATTRGLTPVSFLISVRNSSDTPASAVRLRIDIPESAAVQSVAGDGWACQSGGMGATCERQRLDKGVSPALAATIVPPRGVAQFAVVATVSAAEFDPLADNNSATGQVSNDEPAKEGGCSVARGPGSPSGAPVSMLAALCGLLLLRRRRSRAFVA